MASTVPRNPDLHKPEPAFCTVCVQKNVVLPDKNDILWPDVVPWRGRRVAVSGLRRPDAAFLGILEKYRFLQYGPAKVAGADETDR